MKPASNPLVPSSLQLTDQFTRREFVQTSALLMAAATAGVRKQTQVALSGFQQELLAVPTSSERETAYKQALAAAVGPGTLATTGEKYLSKVDQKSIAASAATLQTIQADSLKANMAIELLELYGIDGPIEFTC